MCVCDNVAHVYLWRSDDNLGSCSPSIRVPGLELSRQEGGEHLCLLASSWPL